MICHIHSIEPHFAESCHYQTTTVILLCFVELLVVLYTNQSIKIPNAIFTWLVYYRDYTFFFLFNFIYLRCWYSKVKVVMHFMNACHWHMSWFVHDCLYVLFIAVTLHDVHTWSSWWISSPVFSICWVLPS